MDFFFAELDKTQEQQYRTIQLRSDMRKWSNKQDLTDCEIGDPSKRKVKRCRVAWNSLCNRKGKLDGEKLNQTKSDSTINTNDQDEGYHQAYTILKKPDVSTTTKTIPTTTTTTINSEESNVQKSNDLEDEIEKKLAQISIEDCKDATEVNVVLS